MQFSRTDIEGVWLIRPERHGDRRGYFCETFRQDEFDRVIGPVHFIQDNESFSRRDVVRGLHFQRPPFAQAKLVRVSLGCVLDVAVDLRPGSPTFGRHIAVRLSADEGTQVYIPRGFAHGFRVISDEAQFQYKVDNTYAPQAEVTIRLDDPGLAIDWGIPFSQMLLSDKDLRGLPLSQISL